MSIISKAAIAILGFLAIGLISCDPIPKPIKLGEDACSFCKMSISDQRFGGEIITKKDKVFMFDDMHCILGFIKANTIKNGSIKKIYLINFVEPHNFIEAGNAFLFKSNDLHSPMGGNIASFSDKAKLKEAMQKFNGETLLWNRVLNE